ncbi:hypothetical protein [Ruegeria sp. MALMAid1280]|uniref:hypothetical protein n=1 Tax=Ruegeria sp. MALMAid1280 TaxID=3411634 RepID=UPI003BA350EE
MLPALRHETQVLHLLAHDVSDMVFNFPSASLSDQGKLLVAIGPKECFGDDTDGASFFPRFYVGG